MDWLQFLILIVTIGTLWLWNHKEIHAIHTEIKDFHGRLCALEEKYYQWLMRERK